MKKTVFVLLLFSCFVGQAQQTRKVCEYIYAIQPYVEDRYFLDINELSKVIVKNKIADSMIKNVVSGNDGPITGYFSWPVIDFWSEEIPKNDFVGVAITQEHTAYPAAVLNYKWNGFGYDLSTQHAFNLIVVAQNVGEKQYSVFKDKISKINTLLGIKFSQHEAQSLINRRPFINSNGKYTYIFFNQGVTAGEASYTYTVIPEIKTKKEIKKASFGFNAEDIRKDTLGDIAEDIIYPSDYPDSLRQLLIDNKLVPEKAATLYPMYFSLAENDSTVFTIINGYYGIRPILPDGSFILAVYPTYYEVGRIVVLIQNNSQPTKEQIENNYNKLLTLYRILRIEVTADLDIFLKNAAATDETTPFNFTITSGSSNTVFNISPGTAKIDISRPYSSYKYVFIPYKQ